MIFLTLSGFKHQNQCSSGISSFDLILHWILNLDIGSDNVLAVFCVDTSKPIELVMDW